jgi:hypothetical protein
MQTLFRQTAFLRTKALASTPSPASPLQFQPFSRSQQSFFSQRGLVAGAILLNMLLAPCSLWLLTSPVSAQTKSAQRRNKKYPTRKQFSKSKFTQQSSLRTRYRRNRTSSYLTQLATRTTQTLPHQTPRVGWLNHYLPADRPRIAGGIWKFLSTDTDHHYHRPDSAFMLSQSPDQIIGFASAADAQEAGYLPGPSVNASNRQNGRWFEQGSNVTIRVATASRQGSSNQGSPSQGSSNQGSLNFRIPASQIPRDVYLIIQATDILADAIDKAADPDTAGAIYRMLRRMRHNSQDYIDLSALTGHREAFADATRWYPTLEMLEQGALAKMNRGGIAEVNRALSRQSTHRARNNARMLIPQVKAAINRSFSDKVARESQRMLGR